MSLLYNDKVIEHFTNPHNVGDLEDASGVGTFGSPVCGDMMKMSIKVDDQGVITDAKFKTYGCGSAIASSSIATDMIIGKTCEEALKITNEDVLNELGGLPSVKIHCSVLSEQSIKAAIYDYAQKNGLEFEGLKGYDPEAAEEEELHYHEEEEGEE